MEWDEASADTVELRVHARDLAVLRSAIREADEALGDWEFETRMGCSREDLRQLAEKLRGVDVSFLRTEADH